MQRRRRKPPRRGAVLLVILSLLVLFLLMAVTYVILASQFRRAATASARIERVGDPPARYVDNVFYQLFRDSLGNSSLFAQSILGDLNGNDFVTGTVGVQPAALAVPVLQAGGQFVTFGFTNGAGNTTLANFLPDITVSNAPDAYAGCVLTMLDGPAKGLSTWVVDYEPTIPAVAPAMPTFGFIRVEAFTTDSTNIVIPNAGDRFLINGRPFNGAGQGYNLATRNIDHAIPQTVDPMAGPVQRPVALLPHYVGYPAPPVVFGGADESYDVPDFQNMYLALVPPGQLSTTNPRPPYWPLAAASKWRGTSPTASISPSYHRPALVNYWINQMVGDTSGLMAPQFPWVPTSGALYPPSAVLTAPSPTQVPIPDAFITLSRMFLFRPMPWDHPGFDGGNLHLRPGLLTGAGRDPGRFWSALINGPWDVDNDGDGVPDSIWIDAGLPVAISKDGRLYKPLAAILIKDMDGRLNVNAQGNLAHLDPSYMAQPNGALAPISFPIFAGAVGGILPRGSGIGPAEVNLGALFGGNVGEHSSVISGRYGPSSLPGVAMTDDPFSQVKNTGLPNDYANQNSSYGSPPDSRGIGMVALDHFGQPLTFLKGLPGETIDDPYELNLSRQAMLDRGIKDSPYTLAELEPLLRWPDVDASKLPDRLLRRAPGTFRSASLSAQTIRDITTTHSSHIPIHNVSVPTELRTQVRNQIGRIHSLPLIEIYRARLRAGIPLPATPTPAQIIARQQAVNAELNKIVPFEIRHGQKFDLNRLFGNGVDDVVSGIQNGVVDEPAEAGIETIWGPPPIPFDNNNDGFINGADASARYDYARHLYCLMMLLKGPNNIDFDANGSATLEETTRVIAQWAVNVVDFRDADAIMTPFEYDMNPWNGWGVDGNLATSNDAASTDSAGNRRRFVWGCERPELLISENITLHDRRTEDLAMPDGQIADPEMMGGNDFDQRLRPRGSFFVELYNPWSGSSKRPAEFYRDSFNVPQNGVVLNKFNTAPNGDQTPVWRMIVVDGLSHSEQRDPDNPFASPAFRAVDIDRTIYFTPVPGIAPVQGQTFLTNLPVAPLLPGRYAVVGSSSQSVDDTGSALDLNGNGVNDYVTTIGRRSTWTEGIGMLDPLGLNYPGTRRIVLEPNIDPTVHQVRVENNTPSSLVPGTAIQPAIAVAINRVWSTTTAPASAVDRSLNLTEPAGGYPATINGGLGVWNPNAADGEGAYEMMPLGSGVTTARDTPFDSAPELTTDNPTPNYRTLHLQRLANPLAPFHSTLNPYRTIDSMAVGLQSFNGVRDDSAVIGGTPEPATRDRGENDPNPGNPRRLLWNADLDRNNPRSNVPPSNQVSHIFRRDLIHTFGSLNEFYGPAFSSGNAPTPAYIGAPNTTAFGHPFPWLNWMNRPFANPMEIMQTPWTSSYALPRKFTRSRGYNGILPYGHQDPIYGHLLNFFQNNNSGGGPSTTAPASQSANLYRLFDAVETPSPFVGTERWYNPSIFSGGSTATASFRPPFNKLSRFRDPGLTNINTIFNTKIWLGHTKGFPGHHSTAKWNEVVASRRGYGATGGAASHYALDASSPTRFANPFRSAAGADLMPAVLRKPDDQINATLLRPAPDPANADNSRPFPLFRYDATGGANKHHDTSRNPAFHYQGMQRLSSTLTTHSNVFAIWITIGFFEVTPGTIDIGHHDGYRLGQELNAENGDVKRHRGFYIVDRSIPVAYEPGQNHNVDRAVLVRRIIE